MLLIFGVYLVVEASTEWQMRFRSSYGGLGLDIPQVARLARNVLWTGPYDILVSVEISGTERIAM